MNGRFSPSNSEGPLTRLGRSCSGTTGNGRAQRSLTLARDQLGASNQRADRLEISVQAREADVARLQRKLDEFEPEVGVLREKFELAAEAHQRERLKLGVCPSNRSAKLLEGKLPRTSGHVKDLS
jgi:hypothetical protein